MEHRVLIVDDVPELADLIELRLKRQGYETVTANTGAQALAIMRSGFHGIIILDLVLPDVGGIELLEQFQAVDKESPIIIITAHGTVDLATEAIKKGAYDFILKSESLIDRLIVSTNNAAKALELTSRVQTLATELEERFQYHQIIGRSAEMKRIVDTLRQIEDSNVTVLIEGESGTGKELVARAIHYRSARRKGPFIPINCAGIPATLLESELFGYAKGAFTGATQNKIGKFEAANGGTIFLDEISEMDLNLQSKLLRVLQEREIEPLGSNVRRRIDIRIISATNRVLLDEVRAGRFREDLYYRLSVFPVRLPPLRERRGDVAPLAHHFLQRIAAEEGKPVRRLDRASADALEAYDFPGNVRELENLISHAVVLSAGETLELNDLPAHVRPRQSSTPTGQIRTITRTGLKLDLPDALRVAFPTEEQLPTVDDLEREFFRHAYELCERNIRRTAMRLNVSRPRVYRHLEEVKRREEEGSPQGPRGTT